MNKLLFTGKNGVSIALCMTRFTKTHLLFIYVENTVTNISIVIVVGLLKDIKQFLLLESHNN